MPAIESRRSPEELARLGAEVFDRRVRPRSGRKITINSSPSTSGVGTTRSTRTIMRPSRASGPAARQPRCGSSGLGSRRHTGWGAADDPRRGQRSR